jgi:hypothetical protein
MVRAKRYGLFLIVALMLGACSKQKEAAMAEVGKIDDACRAGDGEKARSIMLDAAKHNEVFRRAFDAATNSVADKDRINACGLVLTEIKTRLTHS